MKRTLLVKPAKAIWHYALSKLPSRVPDGSSLILAYHNIVLPHEVGRGDASLHLSVDHFIAQLKLAKKEADLVSLPELLEQHGKPGRRIAVTFDDAYVGCVTNGLAACSDAGVRPVVFVAPGLLNSYATWDCRSEKGTWSWQERQYFLDMEKGNAASKKEAESCGLPESYRIASVEELKRAANKFGCDIGNHTNSHINLGALQAADIEAEIAGAAAFLKEHFGNSYLPAIAYPYGIEPVAQSINSTIVGVTNGLLVRGGWLSPVREAVGWSIPRFNVAAGLSNRGFSSKLRGRLGVGIS